MIQTQDTKVVIEQLLASQFHSLRAECSSHRVGSLMVHLRSSQIIEVPDGPNCTRDFLYTLLKHTHEEIGRLTVLAKHTDFLLGHER